MRILLWHGYLLGGHRLERLHARARARMEPRRARRRRSSARSAHPELYDLGGAERGPSGARAAAAGLRARSLRGPRGAAAPGLTAAERDRYVEPQRGGAARAPAGRSRLLRTTCCSGGPVGAATGAPFAVKAHGSELEYSMRGNERAAAWGARARAGAASRLRRLRPHPRGARGRRRPRRARPRGAAGRRRRRVPPQPREEALARLLDEAAATRRTRATRTSGCRTRAMPSVSQRSSQGTSPTVVYFGKLLYNKGVHLLLEALRGLDARAVIVGFGDYREELEAAGAAANALSPARSSTATSSTCSRWPTSRSCRRSSPRRSAWSRPRPPPPAARRSSPATRAWPRSPRGSRQAYRAEHRAARDLREGRLGGARGEAPRAARAPRRGAAAARRRGARRRRRALVLGERRGPPARPFQ